VAIIDTKLACAPIAIGLFADNTEDTLTSGTVLMTHPNAELINRFYHAFQQRDAEAMAACYAEDVRFSDPVFEDLRGSEAADMWRMLTARAQNFSLTFGNVQADERQGSAQWVATYLFSQTGRTVVNRIEAHFVFADGKIVEHRDHFDLWRWARQALGSKGLLLGWAPPVQNAIRRQAAKGLAQFRASR
jgi:ketosteroid isomerase-like protein